METLLAKQTAAASTEKIPALYQGIYGEPICVTFYLLGTLGAGETVKFQYPDGTSWRDSGHQLTSASPVLTLWGAMEFRVTKSLTTAEVGVGCTAAKGVA